MCIKGDERTSVNSKLTPIRSDVGRFVFLSADDIRALRAEVIRRAAELRPGKGETNIGVTPRWYRLKVEQLDALRERLAEAERGHA